MEGRTHKPIIDEALCGLCGVCRGACPSSAFPDLPDEGDSLRGRLGPRYRGKGRKDIPPCQEACPIGQDIPGYLRPLARGDFAGALEVILRDNPMPSVLGHVCHHPCERACASAPVQTPPRLRELKRLAAQGLRPSPGLSSPGPQAARVAVVGSGPAGLAAAWLLARQGARTTVYDAQPVPGGLLAWAIPPFRLPREALEEDIAYILSFGVALQLGTRISPGDLSAIRQEHDAIILALGAPKALKVDLPGSRLKSVYWGLDFLRDSVMAEEPPLEAPVVIVGGGNTAVDAARVAVRRGAPVTLIYRRDPEDMPAYPEEIDAAKGEGVKIMTRTQPLALLQADTGVLGRIRCARTAPGEAGPDGRRRFIPLMEETFELPAGTAILAFGQERETSLWANGLGLAAIAPDKDGRLRPGLYAAGDLVTGPATVVEAMAGGMAAARAVLKDLGR